MNLKVKCIDDKNVSRYNGGRLQYGVVYTVKKLERAGLSVVAPKRVELTKFPGVYYLARRFELMSKEIVINLPDDFEKFPIS